MIEAYKYQMGIYKVADILTPKPENEDGDGDGNEEGDETQGKHNTRGHSKKLPHKRCHLAIRRGFFGVRVPRIWNDLPESVVAAPDVNSFKRRLDRHLSHLKYSTEFPLIKRFERWEERHKGEERNQVQRG